ncbi:MAG TPA: hypothetical protein VI112_04645 [Bacteroidia bacterium]
MLFLSLALFLASLTQNAFYARDSWANPLAILLSGWMGIFFGAANLSWLANPFLLLSWLCLFKKPVLSQLFAIAALFLSFLFLFSTRICVNEGGTSTAIESLGPGYWLWFSAMAVMVAGNYVLYIVRQLES